MTPHVKNFVLQAYLNRELSPQAVDEFELELLSDPELADAAEADTALYVGFAGLQSAKAQSALAHTADKSALAATADKSALAATVVNFPGNTAHTNYPPTTLRARWWPLAAAASMLVLASGWIGLQFRPATQLYGGAALAYVDKQRAIGNEIVIGLPKSGPLVLMVPVASVTPCTAEIAITQNGLNAPLRTQARPDEFGYAVVVLPGNALSPGTAVIDIACAGQPLGQYKVLLRP
jgi:hypothetical protein